MSWAIFGVIWVDARTNGGQMICVGWRDQMRDNHMMGPTTLYRTLIEACLLNVIILAGGRGLSCFSISKSDKRSRCTSCLARSLSL